MACHTTCIIVFIPRAPLLYSMKIVEFEAPIEFVANISEHRDCLMSQDKDHERPEGLLVQHRRAPKGMVYALDLSGVIVEDLIPDIERNLVGRCGAINRIHTDGRADVPTTPLDILMAPPGEHGFSPPWQLCSFLGRGRYASPRLLVYHVIARAGWGRHIETRETGEGSLAKPGYSVITRDCWHCTSHVKTFEDTVIWCATQ